MKENQNKKVFVSSKSDRGILVKFSKGKERVSFSFWGDDEPKNISFSAEEALELCEYIIQNADKKNEEHGTNIFDEAFKNMKNITAAPKFVKYTENKYQKNERITKIT